MKHRVNWDSGSGAFMGIHLGGGSAMEANSAPDGGRWWQMLGPGAKFDHKKELAIAALLSHRNVEAVARAVGIGTAPARPCERTGRGCLAMGKLCASTATVRRTQRSNLIVWQSCTR